MRNRTSAGGIAGARAARSSSSRSIVEVGRKAVLALVTALLLSDVIGAVTATAVTGCTYNPATDTINITIDPGDSAELAVEGDGADLDPPAPDGSILFRANADPFLACGSSSNSNTVAIVALGSPASPETLTLNNLIGGQFATSIEWSIDLGFGGDAFVIDASEDTSDSVVLTNTSFTLNGGGGDLVGVDRIEVRGNGGDDTMDASELSRGSELEGQDGSDRVLGGSANDDLSGGDDDDLITGGAGDDLLDGGAGIDGLYGGDGSDTCVLDSISLNCDPSINVDPSPVPSGGSLTVTGAGWYPENGDVEFVLDPTPGVSFPSLTPDPLAWSVKGPVDAPSAAGTYSVTACQPCSDPPLDLATQSLIVLPGTESRTLSVDPPSVHVRDLAIVSGRDWDPEAGPISLFTDDQFPAGEPFATVPATEAASFERQFEVPRLAEGQHEVTACQRCADPTPIVESASFMVVPAEVTTATLELQPARGRPGDVIRLLGTGWDPGDGDVKIFIDPSASSRRDAVLPPDADQTFAVELDVPDLEQGSYTVLACQRCNGANPVERTVALTVLPKGSAIWRWVLVIAVLVVGALAVVIVRELRLRRLRARVKVRSHTEEPEVTVAAEPNGSTHHRIELVPHTDPGVQRVSEGSST